MAERERRDERRKNARDKGRRKMRKRCKESSMYRARERENIPKEG